MLHDADILALLTARRPGYSLPRDLYTDPAAFRMDVDRIWYRRWLFAIPACEIPKAGNHVVHTVVDHTVIIVRGDDGAIRAFHNSCRHRGSVLCKGEKGSRPKIVCPYHQWTYGLDGSLVWARDMGPEFDRRQHGLKPVHCREVAGLVYICLAETAPPFEEFAVEAARYLAPHDLVNSKVAHQSTIVEKGNWKLVWENNRECYHCAGNHPALCRTFPEDARLIGNGGNGLASELDAHRERCEAVGAPSEFRMAADGFWRFVRMPLLGSAESYTMDGKAAVARPNSSFPFRNAGALLKFLYPSSWNHFLGDHAIVFRVTPLGPTETEVTTKWLVHKDAVEGRDYDLNRLTEVWIATNAEDRTVVEDNQRGILSPSYEPGPLSNDHEAGIVQFQDWYAATLTGVPALHDAVAAE
ncbi:aromatic ring-hydroxylating dioxygenase subunit alpha [Azospirillum sp. 11R-A]|uniref:aromatic ring-hydroxylating oxygenase subunit alpha n=1 Tax=Azospirillum sp. 11R-A TaxID=3111634 RepID=UPI003C298103